MGIPRPKHLTDLLRLGAHLRVTCTKCGHSGVFPVKDVIAYFRSRGWNLAWDSAGTRFRCEGTAQAPGCTNKGARLSLVQPDQRPNAPLPQPTARDRKIQLRRERS
jgi:hypothetical protein